MGYLFKWTARIVGTMVVILILTFFGAHIINDLTGEQSGNDKPLTFNTKLSFFFIGLMTAGLVIAWRWKLPGGLVTVLAYTSFLILVPDAIDAWHFAVCAICGVLFIASVIFKREQVVVDL